MLPHLWHPGVALGAHNEVEGLQGAASSWEPFTSTTETVDRSDPREHQIEHFAAVIRGEATSIRSGRDGLKTLLVVNSVMDAARTGQPVDIAG